MGFYDARQPVADHDPTQQIQWNPGKFIGQFDPFAMVSTLLTHVSNYIRQWPVLGDLIAPFLDAIADLANDVGPDKMIQFLTDPIGWAKRILSFIVSFVRGWPILGDLIAPFLDAIDALIDDAPETMVEFLTDPIGWAKRILRFVIGFLRSVVDAVPVLGDFLDPFLDAIEDLINDAPATLIDFLNPIKWAKIFIKFGAHFLEAVPILGTQIAPFLDALVALADDAIDDAAPMLALLNPATWMQWILGGFLGQFGIDFSWLAGLTSFNLGGSNFFTGVMELLGNPLGLLSGNTSGFAGLALSAIPFFGPLLAGAVGGGLPFNVQNLFGLLPGNLFGHVPIGSLSSDQPNLLPQGLFPPGSIALGDGWSVDTGKTATADSTGSAKRDADSKSHALRSIPIALAPDKTVNLSVKAWWQALVSSGSPIQMSILKYKNGVEVGRQVLASTPASGTSSSWYNLTSSYTTPADGSVDAIKLRPIITATAVSGSVWFDDAVAQLPGEIEQDWVTNLLPQFDGIKGLFNLSSILDLIGIDPHSAWGSLITSLLNPFEVVWNKLYDIFGGVLGSATKTLTSVFTIGKTFFDTIASAAGATFTQLTTRFTEILQLGQALAGTAITPITSLISNVLTRIQYIGTNGLISQSGIIGLATDLTARVLKFGTDGFWDLAERMARVLTGNNWTTPSLSNFFSWGETFVGILSRSNGNLTNLDTTHLEHYQTKQVLAKINITPINSLIQSIYDFWF